MTPALAVATTVVVGLMVGVELAVGFVVNPILLRLPAGASLAGRADGGRPEPVKLVETRAVYAL